MSARVVLRSFVALAVALPLAALASLAPLSPSIAQCAGAGPSHAALVLEHGNGSVVTRCVAFSGASISGQQLLEQSGIAWSGQTFAGFGVAVCALDREPASYSSCPGSGSYWAVFSSRGGAAWQLSAVGISSLTLRDGDMEGFRYLPSSGTPVAPPLARPCAAAPAATAVPASRAPSAPASASPSAGATPTGATPSGATPPAGASPTSTAGAAPSPSPTSPPAPSAPANPSGPDLGLLAAAFAGGGLAGLAILRVALGRRHSPRHDP